MRERRVAAVDEPEDVHVRPSCASRRPAARAAGRAASRPALFTRMSKPPSSSFVRCTNARACSSSPMSASIASAPSTDLLDERVEAVLAARGERHLRAGLRERHGGRLPDPRRRAGDRGDLAFERSHPRQLIVASCSDTELIAALRAGDEAAFVDARRAASIRRSRGSASESRPSSSSTRRVADAERERVARRAARFETWSTEAVPEDAAVLDHSLEGADDMPAHIKASISAALTLPMRDGRSRWARGRASACASTAPDGARAG